MQSRCQDGAGFLGEGQGQQIDIEHCQRFENRFIDQSPKRSPGTIFPAIGYTGLNDLKFFCEIIGKRVSTPIGFSK